MSYHVPHLPDRGTLLPLNRHRARCQASSLLALHPPQPFTPLLAFEPTLEYPRLRILLKINKTCKSVFLQLAEADSKLPLIGGAWVHLFRVAPESPSPPSLPMLARAISSWALDGLGQPQSNHNPVLI